LNDQWVSKETSEKFKMFLKSNENEHTTYQNLWDIAKILIRGKFILMSAYIKKKTTETFQINNLLMHFKL
jgi:hypothetical protein